MIRGRHSAALLTVATVVVMAGLISGCGSQEEQEGTTSTFEIVLPDDGETGTSQDTKPLDPTLPDSETNDLPPEPDSPQEAFEKFCRENPRACG